MIVKITSSVESVHEIISAETMKSVEEIAREVIAGKWGSGNERRTKLTEAGYSYSEVQTVVNSLLK